MQIILQDVLNTNTFKDFHVPNSAMCQSLGYHIHSGSSTTRLDITKQNFQTPPQAVQYRPSAAKFDTEKQNTINNPEKGIVKKALPLAGALIGTVLPLIVLNKSKGKSLNTDVLKNGKILGKIKEIGEYLEIDSVKEVLSTAGGAIAGGLLGGFISDKNKENRKEKVKNAVFEMINITVPTFFVVGTEKLLSSAKMNPALKKIIPIALGVGIGAPVASKISSAINKKAFKEDKAKQRHFRPKDYLVHIDDIVTAFALARLPYLKAVPFDKILAFIYIHCGYEAGSKDVNDIGHKGHDHCH